MKYYKVHFSGDISGLAYQVVDDSLTNVIKYINIDGTDLNTDNSKYSCNVIDSTIYTDDDILPGLLWHDITCSKRIKFSNHNNLLMLQMFPELGVFIKTENIFTVVESDYTYIYVNTILPEYRDVLNMFNAEIIEK